MPTLIIDSARCCVHREGREIHLALQAYRVLLYLGTHGGRVVAKDELAAVMWPDAGCWPMKRLPG